MYKLCPIFNLKTTSEKHKLFDNRQSTSYESEDDGIVATDTLDGNEDSENDIQYKVYQDDEYCISINAKTTKLIILKKENEDIHNGNKHPVQKERFYSANEKDHKEIFNKEKQEIGIVEDQAR